MTTRLRVVTYNIHKCRGLDRRVDPDRIAAVLFDFDADIIALQEILDVQDAAPQWNQARRIHAKFPGYQRCFGENRPLPGGGYGNMTLSRFPVRLCRNYDVSWRRRERRGCLRSDLFLSDGSVLHVFNVHLGTSFIERRHQARRLVSDKVLNLRECCGPRIVVGDFNEWTRGLASRLMGQAVAARLHRAFARYSRCYPAFLPLMQLDHI